MSITATVMKRIQSNPQEQVNQGLEGEGREREGEGKGRGREEGGGTQ